MTPRTRTIIGLATAAALAGPVVLRWLPGSAVAVPWFGHLLVAAGAAVGAPMVLGSAGSGGDFAAVARLWSVLGGLATVLAAAGGSAAAVSLGSGAVSSLAVLVLSAGAGLLAGLGLVKLALRRASAQAGT